MSHPILELSNSAVQAPRSCCAGLRLDVRLDDRSPRRWHIDLLGRLALLPGIAVTVGTGARALPAGAESLLRLDSALHGVPRGAAAAAAPSELDPYRGAAGEPADLVLDLGGTATAGAGRVWRLTFDGMPGERALLDLLLDGRTPLAAIEERRGGTSGTVAAGRIGAEHSGSIVAMLDDALARTTTLILAAFAGTCRTVPTLPPEPGGRARRRNGLSIANLGARLAEQAAASALRALYRRRYVTPHWRVGWRRPEGPDVLDLRRHPDAGWHTLADDGLRFYADPFPIEHDGRLTLFVEAFEHAVGKGIISAVEFGPHGPLGHPEPVLELPYHLSYPFVFARDGEVWMIPEGCAAGTIDLFRATRFPAAG